MSQTSLNKNLIGLLRKFTRKVQGSHSRGWASTSMLMTLINRFDILRVSYYHEFEFK